MLFHHDNALSHKLMATMAKLHELHFELLLHSPYFPDLVPSNYWLFADLRRMLKIDLVPMKNLIPETDSYFKAKNESFYTKDIESLEKRWNQCITLEGAYVDE